MSKSNQDLTDVEKGVLSQLSDKLGFRFVVASGRQGQAVLSNEQTIKVKITDPELKQILLDKKPVNYQAKLVRCGKEIGKIAILDIKKIKTGLEKAISEIKLKNLEKGKSDMFTLKQDMPLKMFVSRQLL
ncbi:hypothetical protein IBX65_08370 [Candidatus Aerophobetes bacterium]|nr:hypothetical protein [Candidatus Aerophobetes bacterium]